MWASRILWRAGLVSLAGLLSGSAASWWWLVCYQPSFWVRAYERVSVNNHTKLARLESEFARLDRQLRRGRTFQVQLPEDSVTAWCRRVLEPRYYRMMPCGMTWLLVAFRRDGIHFGFQDLMSPGRPVTTMNIRPRLVDGSSVLLELSDIRRGRVRQPGSAVRRFAEETWLGGGMQLEWAGCHAGSAYVVLRMDPTLVARGLCLTRFESIDNEFIIAGECPRPGIVSGEW